MVAVTTWATSFIVWKVFVATVTAEQSIQAQILLCDMCQSILSLFEVKPRFSVVVLTQISLDHSTGRMHTKYTQDHISGTKYTEYIGI